MKEPQRMRGDVTALMGIPLATFTMVENKFSLFLPREGESFSSTQGDLLVKKLTGLELSPVLLYEILSNKLPKGKDWKCNLNENDMPECQNLNNKVMISWLIKSHEAQDLEFAKDRTKVRINVSRHPVEKEIKDSVFQISTTR